MNNIRLDRLEFVGFKDLAKRVCVDFSPTSVSVIYGENGSGKTSFLKAISAFLSQDDAALSALSVRKIICGYSDGTDHRELVVERKEISYDWSGLVECPLKDARSISLGVERGISTQASRIEPELIYEFFRRTPRYRTLFQHDTDFSAREIADDLAYYLRRRQNPVRDRRDDIDESRAHLNLQNIKLDYIERILLNHYRVARYSANLRIQSALFNTLADAIDRDSGPYSDLRKDLFAKITEYRSRLIEALTDDGAQENQFKLKIVGILEGLTEQAYCEEVANNVLLSSLFSNMIEELEKEKLALGSINLLVETFNKYLIDDKKLVISNSEIYIAIGDNHHSVHELSSGERHILTFLSMVLFQGLQRNFLIIDEPEISLNLTWQRQLLDLFRNLVPGTQIIVASHSPVLAKRHPEFLTPLKWGKE